MIPNGHGVIEPVRCLEETEMTEFKDDVKGLILPKDLHTKWFVDQGDDHRTDEEIFADDYKVKTQTPFYLAMNHGWDGVGFLLMTMKQEKFTALTGCLQARKYGKFLDLLESVPQGVVTSTDAKGRNLLLILVRYLGEMEKDSQELTKALEVIQILTAQVKPLTAKSFTAQKGYGLPIESKDNRGYNILHTLALHCSLKMSLTVLKSLEPSKRLPMLTEQAKVKSKAAPLVLMAQMLESDDNKGEYIDLLNQVKTLVGAGLFKAMPWTYEDLSDAAGHEEVPDFLDFERALIGDNSSA